MEALNQRLLVKMKRDLDKGLAVDLRTYKKDRGLAILPREAGYEIREAGFQDQVFSAPDWPQAKKVLKTIMKREFPRSHRVHYGTFRP